VIGLDTSVVVRYLVGSPHAEAAEAAALIDGDDECGISLVALAEAAHVLRTQYEVEQRDIIDLAHHATLDCPPTEHRGKDNPYISDDWTCSKSYPSTEVCRFY